MGKYYVYKYYSDEHLLYVGRTNDFVERFKQHLRENSYFDNVISVEIIFDGTIYDTDINLTQQPEGDFNNNLDILNGKNINFGGATSSEINSDKQNDKNNNNFIASNGNISINNEDNKIKSENKNQAQSNLFFDSMPI